ncbi:MAG: hypothetical protein R2710_19275 [Acidimicrobiales bacterium]
MISKPFDGDVVGLALSCRRERMGGLPEAIEHGARHTLEVLAVEGNHREALEPSRFEADRAAGTRAIDDCLRVIARSERGTRGSVVVVDPVDGGVSAAPDVRSSPCCGPVVPVVWEGELTSSTSPLVQAPAASMTEAQQQHHDGQAVSSRWASHHAVGSRLGPVRSCVHRIDCSLGVECSGSVPVTRRPGQTERAEDDTMITPTDPERRSDPAAHTSPSPVGEVAPLDVTVCIATYRRNDELVRLFSGLAGRCAPNGMLRWTRTLVLDNSPDAGARRRRGRLRRLEDRLRARAPSRACPPHGMRRSTTPAPHWLPLSMTTRCQRLSGWSNSIAPCSRHPMLRR